MRDLIDQSRTGVHLADELAHVSERRVVGLDHDLESRMLRPKLEVGHDDGDLHEFVLVEIQARHLAVDPYESIVLGSAHHVDHPSDGPRHAGLAGDDVPRAPAARGEPCGRWATQPDSPSGRIRTPDLAGRNRSLCPLSYGGKGGIRLPGEGRRSRNRSGSPPPCQRRGRSRIGDSREPPVKRWPEDTAGRSVGKVPAGRSSTWVTRRLAASGWRTGRQVPSERSRSRRMTPSR